MSDMFDDTPVDEFALPGDDALIRKISVVEPPAAEPETYEAEPDVVEPVEKPRDEHGRFTKAEDAAAEPAADDTLDEPVAETAAEASDRLLAGNFKNVDDLERAYEDLRSRFGQQGNELGEIRKAFDERLDRLDQRLATPAAPPQQITQDMIDQNPGYATTLAFEQGNQGALAVAYEAWKVDDPAAAGAWLGAKQAEEKFDQRFQAQQEQIAQLEAKLGPAVAATDEQQRGALVAAAAAKYPGLAEFVQSDAIGELAAEIPDIGNMLVSGAPDQQVRAITLLHEIHRGRLGDNLKVTQQEVARATAEEAQQAREDAFVASSTMAATGTKLSKAEQYAAEWDAMDAPYNDGWNV